ncbi:hypothetical protein Scep_007180 [Stephania cephalantha]|uniref:Uncharacterized protein n=1 Tax=Stephania cephalantha TaxID=152367 RepID=A0AAP0K997_9MAGN
MSSKESLYIYIYIFFCSFSPLCEQCRRQASSESRHCATPFIVPLSLVNHRSSDHPLLKPLPLTGVESSSSR